MKKKLSIILASLIAVSSFAACDGEKKDDSNNTTASSTTTAAGNDESKDTTTAGDESKDTTTPAPATPGNHDGVTLNVFTSFAGEDGGASDWSKYKGEWETATKAKITDMSEVIDDTVKNKVSNDFNTGAEADVYFYLATGATEGFLDKIVTISEIKAVYPEFAGNQNEALFPIYPDGKKYGVPMYGFWEGLFTNKAVVDEAGATVPTKDTTWDEFLASCESVKGTGKAPIAMSIAEVPHYWFDFCVFNNQATKDAHFDLPTADNKDDPINKAWAAGLNDIKDLFDKGYFNSNSTTIGHADAANLFKAGDAAFFADGSWATNGLIAETDGTSTPVSENLVVAYVPGKKTGERTAGDILGGLSSAWFISKKCWDDEAKRAAAVDLIDYITSTAVLTSFSAAKGCTSALIDNSGLMPDNPHAAWSSAMEMLGGAVSVTPPVQDQLSATQSPKLMKEEILRVAKGEVNADDAVITVMSS